MKCWGKWDGGKGRVREIGIKAVGDKLSTGWIGVGGSIMCAIGFSGAAPLCGACWQGPRRARPASPGRSPTRLVWLGSFLCACGMMEIEGW